LLDTQVAVLANQAMNYLVSGETPHRLGNAHPNIAPYQTFAVADGHVIVAVGNDGQFRRLCALLGRPALGEEPGFRDQCRPGEKPGVPPYRPGAPDRAARPRRAAGRTRASGIPAGPINDVAQVFADPQIVARDLQIERNGIPRSPPRS
jgi:crotonobetainyl-CoA:carnitine CoA-transferase CaiB-like acyl-CoA transferase